MESCGQREVQRPLAPGSNWPMVVRLKQFSGRWINGTRTADEHAGALRSLRHLRRWTSRGRRFHHHVGPHQHVDADVPPPPFGHLPQMHGRRADQPWTSPCIWGRCRARGAACFLGGGGTSIHNRIRPHKLVVHMHPLRPLATSPKSTSESRVECGFIRRFGGGRRGWHLSSRSCRSPQSFHAHAPLPGAFQAKEKDRRSFPSILFRFYSPPPQRGRGQPVLRCPSGGG